MEVIYDYIDKTLIVTVLEIPTKKDGNQEILALDQDHLNTHGFILKLFVI